MVLIALHDTAASPSGTHPDRKLVTQTNLHQSHNFTYRNKAESRGGYILKGT